MPIATASGASTPFSSTSTLSGSPPPYAKKLPEDIYKKAHFSASNVIEYIASRSRSTSTVHIYDLAEQAGFGILAKSWSESDDDTAPVVSLQTRAGAGLSLVGRLSEGTSRETARGAVLTAFTTPTGLAAMAQSLSYLPVATPTSRLIIQVPTVTPVGERFTLSPTLAPLATVMTILPPDMVVLASATPQESIDFAALSFGLKSSHVVHLFDHHGISRETGHTLSPPSLSSSSNMAVKEAFEQAGYSFFEYTGAQDAITVIFLLNGPLALTAKDIASKTAGLGVVTVKVLRPWDESALRSILPTTVREVHVLDDVPNEITLGALYVDVISTLLDSPNAPIVQGHRITPLDSLNCISQSSAFVDFMRTFIPTLHLATPVFDSPQQKKLLFFSIPKSPLSALPHFIQDTFTINPVLSIRSLVEHDVFSRAGGITADRVILSANEGAVQNIPLPLLLPISSVGPGEADFLAILDHALLKSHALLANAKVGSTVLVVTSWSSMELKANLPPEVNIIITQKSLQLYIIDVKAAASTLVGAAGPAHDAIQTLLAHLAFLRLYLGTSATEALVHNVASKTFGVVVQGIELAKVNAHAWAGLQKVRVLADISASDKAQAPLRVFEFNAIAVETDDGDTVVNGSKLGSWHNAAKHLLFPSIFTPPVDVTDAEEYPQTPTLRPEVHERTFLVTTTVNRRLTPLEYNRNVFHLEFDTSGTGLTYAIGEALGVHGWNDEKDVLDFCSWYGADLRELITMPIVAGESDLHTRTVFQALQQQIDLFGRPPKSFYTDLAPYATNSLDKHALLFIGSPEGSATFKKLAEKDTITFAEVLRRYPSARPSIERLCEMIGDIKPRHYSIASAQKVVGDRVDLLVVTVDWVTPDGKCFQHPFVNLHSYQACRISAVRTMHEVSCWAQDWSKSHSLYQAQCDEGKGHL